MSKAKTKEPVKTHKSAGLTADYLAYVISMLGVISLPLLFIPWSSVPLGMTKTFWLFLTVLLTAILWGIGRLQTGSLVIPKNPALLAGAGIGLLALLSSLFSGNILHSLMGNGLESGSLIGLVSLLLLFFFLSVVYDKKQKVINTYVLLFGASILVGLYTIVKFIIGGIFTNPIGASLPANLIGSWYGLGIFFGLIALSALIMLELFPVRDSKWFGRLLYFVFGFSLVILAFVNFYPTWVIFGLASLLLFVYVITVGDATHQQAESKHITKIIRPAFVALILSLFFVILGGQNGLMSDALSRVYNQANFAFVDVRPSWSSTGDVMKGALRENVLLGVGLNNFDQAWLAYRPQEINQLPYWNVDFTSGVGALPSLVVTNGMLGIIAWIVLLGYLLFYGIKGIFDKKQDIFTRLVIFMLFVGSVYLWVFALIYPISVTLMILAFAVSGLLVAQLSAGGVTPTIKIDLTQTPKVNFSAVMGFVLVIMVSLTGSYLVIQKYWSASIFYNAISTTNQSIEDTERQIIKAVRIDDSNDLYFRTLSEIGRIKMSTLLQSDPVSEDQLREQFQNMLIQTTNYSESALKINPQDYQNWVSRGLVYEMLVPLRVEGAANEARSAYDKARELNPHSPAIRIDLARLSFAEGDEAKARQYLEEALKQKSNFTTPLFMLAQLDLRAGRTQQAIEKAEQATLIAPNDAGAYFQLGVLRYETGDYQGAITSLEKSITLSPGQVNANAQYFLGLSHDFLGQRVKALEQFELIQKFNPDNQEVKQIIANLRAGRPALSGLTGDANQDETGDEAVDLGPLIEEN